MRPGERGDTLQAAAEQERYGDLLPRVMEPRRPAQTCGCFDGPDIAIRCWRHEDVPAAVPVKLQRFAIPEKAIAVRVYRRGTAASPSRRPAKRRGRNRPRAGRTSA